MTVLTGIITHLDAARVTVALYQGNALPGTVLNAVAALSGNGEGAATPIVKPPP